MVTTKRKRCRVCDKLAGLTADICNGCRMAEVRSHIKMKGRAGEPKPSQLQDAHGQSLLTLPPVSAPKEYTASAIYSAVAAGLDGSLTAVHNFKSETLANAQRFSATLGGVPSNASTAQIFFSYSQKSFYRHMRTMLAALDPIKKLPGRKRKTKTSKNTSFSAQSAHNVALAKAMRFLRVYMQVETIPLALKLDSSQTLIWHIESCNNCVQPKWVEAYAKVFDVSEENIYAYAASLFQSAGDKIDYRATVTDFVDICLRGKKVPGTCAFQKVIFANITEVQGAKLNRAVAQEIKNALSRGERAALIADRYNVSRSAVQDIKKGRSWL